MNIFVFIPLFAVHSFIFDHYYSGSIIAEKSNTISKFAEERMKLYEESLAKSKAALISTNLPKQDIKSPFKDLSNTEKVQEEETQQTGRISK